MKYDGGRGWRQVEVEVEVDIEALILFSERVDAT